MTTYRRKHLPAALAIGTATLALIACGDDDSASNNASSGDLDGQQAIIQTFGGVLDQAVTKGIVEPVEQKTGLEVALDGPTDYGKIETEVKSGNVSTTLAQTDPWWAIQQCGKLLQRIPAKVDVSDIDPRFLTKGNCSVPGDIFVWTLVYDDSKFSGKKPTTWADFFDTKNFPGKRAMWGGNAINGVYEAALLADGVAPDKLYPLDLDRAYAKLDTIKDDIVFYDTIAQSDQQLVAGEVAMSVAINGTGYTAAKRNNDVTPSFSAGGIAGWDAYGIPKGANTAAATALLNQIASPDSQAVVSNAQALGQTVKNPKVEGDKAQQAWNPSSPANAPDVIPQDQAYYAENSDEVFDRWTAWTAG